MPEPIISKKTLYEFQEYLVHNSVVRGIEILFDSADISCDERFQPAVSGERRKLISQYYHTIDTTNGGHVRKLLRVFEEILSSLEAQIKEDEDRAYPIGNLEENRKTFERLQLRLKHDCFTYQDGKIVSIGQNPSLIHLESIAESADFPYLLRQLDRIENSIDSDPWLAIGTAKELVETTCKTILTEMQITIDKNWDVSNLCFQVRNALKLTPNDIPNTSQAAQTVKMLLGNLATIVQGLAELRNPYGTGHGHEGRARGLQPRHARLAAGAASTLAIFLLETHREAKKAVVEKTTDTL
jgi:Abortive infection C-terminus